MTRTISTRHVWGAMLVALATFMLVLAPTSRAEASTQWIDGAQVTSQPGDASSFLGDRERTSCTWRAYATVVKEGDHVYIRDDCADGIAATVWVQWDGAGGATETRYCVNRHGAGTIAHCNLDWVETGTSVKTFVAGLEVPSPVEGQWQWGQYVHIYD